MASPSPTTSTVMHIASSDAVLDYIHLHVEVSFRSFRSILKYNGIQIFFIESWSSSTTGCTIFFGYYPGLNDTLLSPRATTTCTYSALAPMWRACPIINRVWCYKCYYVPRSTSALYSNSAIHIDCRDWVPCRLLSRLRYVLELVLIQTWTLSSTW